MGTLEGRVALVTGAARGIGAATCAALAAEGAQIVAAVRRLESSSELDAHLRSTGRQALIAPCDVARHDQVAAVVTSAADRFGHIDILINNAGMVEPIGRIEDTEPERWHQSVLVNLGGAYNCTRAVIPYFRQQGGGVVVNLSSGAAHQPREGWSAYCSSKAGLAMLTRSLSHEYASHGVRAYGFQPGVVDTGMQELIRASGMNEISRLKREDLAPSQEPARIIAYLCADEAADLAGSELSVRDPSLRRRVGLAFQ